jgi:hypothetical protein
MPTVHLARDHDPHEVERQLLAGRWRRVRRGVYVEVTPGAAPADLARQDDLARLEGLRRGSTAAYVASHTSAAALWGLPLLRPPTASHVTQEWLPNRRNGAGIVRHVSALPDGEITDRHGHRVTTLERTAVDCAMTLGLRGGVVVMDAALHAGADATVVAATVAALAGRRGIRDARRVLEHADGGAESPGESLTRLCLVRGGLPRPQTQIAVETHLGTVWADLGWREARALVEYDGRTKYGSSGSTTTDLLAERRREVALIEAGWRVLRVTAVDLRDARLLVARARRLLAD